MGFPARPYLFFGFALMSAFEDESWVFFPSWKVGYVSNPSE